MPYSTLSPGERSSYRTFTNHPWLFREVAGGRRMCLNKAQAVVATAGEQTVVEITEPPLLPWRVRAP
jgi:hypothetical protein